MTRVYCVSDRKEQMNTEKNPAQDAETSDEVRAFRDIISLLANKFIGQRFL